MLVSVLELDLTVELWSSFHFIDSEHSDPILFNFIYLAVFICAVLPVHLSASLSFCLSVCLCVSVFLSVSFCLLYYMC